MIITGTTPRGFTLVELLASMAVGGIILLAAAAMLGNSGAGYERVSSGIGTEREARAALNQIASDLAGAVFHKDTRFDESSNNWRDDRIGFLTMQPDEAQTDRKRIGDLCAVNYRIEDITSEGRVIRSLMRGFRESSEVFEAMRQDKLRDLFEPERDLDEPIAFGVISFEARPKTLGNDGRWSAWSKNDTRAPDALELAIVLARRPLANRLKQAADWDGTTAAGRAIGNADEADRNPELETYRTIVRFGNPQEETDDTDEAAP
ncbi:MAG: prepilin-type N-terminal cleavage/methylation domain-containing protein [Verrucomicrobia bacterium]|nr:prepilin-type N-terminal cleavage/methylation domain-containing protein [Verrucomicrobiota bacterium]